MKKIIYSLGVVSCIYVAHASENSLNASENINEPVAIVQDATIEIAKKRSSKNFEIDERKIVKPIGNEIMCLSIDGGGIRGIIPAVLIAALEEMITEKMNDGAEHYIADYVDCISGISVGGIIATLISVTDDQNYSYYSGSDIYHLLRDNGADIFRRNIFSCFGLLRPLYTNANLIKMAKKKLSDVMKDECDYPKLSDIKKVNFIGLAVDIANEKTVLYKNWKAAEDPKYDYYLHDVAVSTSSAPYYFPSYYLENVNGEAKHRMCDGGMCLNNPSQVVYNSMHKFFPEKKINIISIGTGACVNEIIPNYNKGSGSILFWAGDIINTFMWSDANNIDYALKNDSYNVNYERLQTPLLLASSAMDDTNSQNMLNLKQDALSYLDSNFEEFEKIANLLIANKDPNKKILQIDKSNIMKVLEHDLNRNL